MDKHTVHFDRAAPTGSYPGSPLCFQSLLQLNKNKNTYEVYLYICDTFSWMDSFWCINCYRNLLVIFCDTSKPTAFIISSVSCFWAIEAVGQTSTDQLLEDSLRYRHHHGRGGRVAEPHGQKHRATHEPQHQPAREGASSFLAPEQRQCWMCLGVKSTTDMPGFAPATITMRRAMRLCRFHFSMEDARQMTPISSRVVSLQYSAATWNTHKDDGWMDGISLDMPWPLETTWWTIITRESQNVSKFSQFCLSNTQ